MIFMGTVKKMQLKSYASRIKRTHENSSLKGTVLSRGGGGRQKNRKGNMSKRTGMKLSDDLRITEGQESSIISSDPVVHQTTE